MTRPFEEYRETPLWRAIAEVVADLEASREISVATAPDYVIGYVCQRLVAAHLATDAARAYDP